MWKKYFKLARNESGIDSPLTHRRKSNTGEDAIATNSYPNMIPESYVGCPNRISRYQSWEGMDCDSEVNSALDILAEFSTQADEQNHMCFTIKYKDTPTETESKLIDKQLQSWYYLNEFNKRAFRLFRNVLKYGDQVFIRDPETFKLFYVEMDQVIKVIVNESDGKKPEQYIIRNINPNFQNLTITQVASNNLYNVVPSGPGYSSSGSGYNMPNSPNSSSSRFVHGQNENCIDATNILHLSLTEGLDPNWPFGNSILELIFKVFKQKELLEDSILIYRVQRAPERRVFKIDVGDMPSHMAMQFMEKVKNEMHQRRIPGRAGNENFMDSSYQGLPPNADFFFPQTAAGRGSSVEILPGGCLEMSTMVPLLDGRTLSLTELTDEFNSGKENWVYSCDPTTGHVVPGIVSWAGVTQESAKVMKITLDNGKTVTSTLDHKFPILGRGFVEANSLVIGDRFIPFNTQNKVISKNAKNQYTQVYQNDNKKWEYVHRLIGQTLPLEDFVYNDDFKDEKKDVIHHKDHNRYNNNPTNLVKMSWNDHRIYHADHGFSKEAQVLGCIAAVEKMNWVRENDPATYKEIMDRRNATLTITCANRSEEERLKIHENHSIGLKKYLSSLTPGEAAARGEISRKNINNASEEFLKLLKTDSECYAAWYSAKMNGWNKFKESPEFLVRNARIGESHRLRKNDPAYIASRKKVSVTQKIRCDKDILDYIQGLLRANNKLRLVDVVNNINSNSTILGHYLDINKDINAANWNNDRITSTQINSAVKSIGYANWRQFKKEVKFYNHAIVKIEFLTEPIQVGTLTIDKDEKYHNYHTFALASGIFTKNSNLNEINDLLYFNNKMMRGLRIPSSYLPTGPEESSATLNDGRVGTALIQEFRFNQYCQRLQKLICGPLDVEFKAYLKFCGINIDSSIFQLEFTPPQNFASYRQAELDSAKINTFTQLEAYPYFSKRWLMTRFLGLKPDELLENQEMWREENISPEQYSSEPSDFRNIGITPGGIEGDMETFGGGEDMGMGEESSEMPGGSEEAGAMGGGGNVPTAGTAEASAAATPGA
jgi:hypothetical protein